LRILEYLVYIDHLVTHYGEKNLYEFYMIIYFRWDHLYQNR
jgi:hypothetical protein